MNFSEATATLLVAKFTGLLYTTAA